MADTKDILDKLQPHFAQIAGNLWAQHRDDIAALIADSPDNTVKIAFSAKIDLSEHQPRMKVGISFSKPYSEIVSFELDDPDQLPLLEPEPTIEHARNGRSVAVTLPESRNGHDALDGVLSGHGHETEELKAERRGRGRPKGSRNKPKDDKTPEPASEPQGEVATVAPGGDEEDDE